jgi:phosphoketolase
MDAYWRAANYLSVGQIYASLAERLSHFSRPSGCCE